MFINPQKVVENLQIAPGMKVADFGTGSGDFSLAASRLVGGSGVIYAIDIKKEALEALKSRAKILAVFNIETIRADLERPLSTTLKEGMLDYVIIANVIFQITNKDTAAREAFRILKPGGKIILIEWNKEAGKFGPPPSRRLSKEDANNLFEIRGFHFEREFYAGDYHYGMIFRKD